MWIEILLFFALLFLWFYHYVTKQFDEFKKRGIPFAEPSFPFGSRNAKKMLSGELSFFHLERELVENEFPDEKVFGYFMMGQPTVVINDEELAKAVMVKDFDHFSALRPMGYESDSMDSQIFHNQLTALHGDKYKRVRALIGRVFTSGKLKLMSPHLVKCGEQLEQQLEKIATGGGEDNTIQHITVQYNTCLLYTSPSPRDS